MIWVDGRVVPDDALKVSALDRTFEHGLGLFETFRTWNGLAPLLDRHMARLTRSARELGLPVDSVALPDAVAVAALRQAEQVEDDVVLRVTLTGGVSETGGATLWMRTLPLPPAFRRDGAVVAAGHWRLVRNDPLARHKTLNYWSRRQAFETAQRLGFDEALSMTLGWCVWEGSRTNLFVVQGDTLSTPSTNGPIVPGVMRGLVLERARDLLFHDVREVDGLREPTLEAADEVFLTNSVRGVVPVEKIFPDETVKRLRNRTWPAPGPWTQRLSLHVNDWLQRGGDPP